MTDHTATAPLAADPLVTWDGPLGLPDFGRISDDDFATAFDAALAAHDAEIEAIASNPQPPTIDNTLAALELAGKPPPTPTTRFRRWSGRSPRGWRGIIRRSA